VVRKNQKYGSLPILTGVPQGSVLGPLLFLLYINDLPAATNLLKIVLFADDCNLLLLGKDPKVVCKDLTKELGNIYNWFCAKKLLPNAGKTKLVVFRSRKCRKDLSAPPVVLNDTELAQVTNVSFLEVQFDETLKWYEHTCKVANTRAVVRIRGPPHNLSLRPVITDYYNFFKFIIFHTVLLSPFCGALLGRH
jgi:hypothetical protein